MLGDVWILPGPSKVVEQLEWGHGDLMHVTAFHVINMQASRRDSLKLQGGDMAGEAGDDTGHLPGPQGGSVGPGGAALGQAIMLTEAPDYGRMSMRGVLALSCRGGCLTWIGG